MKSFIMLTVLFGATLAFADAAPVISNGQFLADIFAEFQKLGGASGFTIAAAVLMLVTESLQVPLVTQYFWDKLGGFQVFTAPLLGIITGIVAMKASGSTMTLAGLVAWALTGAGAVFINEILNGVKQLPGIGAIYVSIVDFIQSLIPGGGNSSIKK